jgi:hypothetical protein
MPSRAMPIMTVVYSVNPCIYSLVASNGSTHIVSELEFTK